MPPAGAVGNWWKVGCTHDRDHGPQACHSCHCPGHRPLRTILPQPLMHRWCAGAVPTDHTLNSRRCHPPSTDSRNRRSWERPEASTMPPAAASHTAFVVSSPWPAGVAAAHGRTEGKRGGAFQVGRQAAGKAAGMALSHKQGYQAREMQARSLRRTENTREGERKGKAKRGEAKATGRCRSICPRCTHSARCGSQRGLRLCPKPPPKCRGGSPT